MVFKHWHRGSRLICIRWVFWYLGLMISIFLLDRVLIKHHYSSKDFFPSQITLPLEMAPIDIYKYADKLIVGNRSERCTWSIGRQIYYCAGHCPWVPKKLVKCDFLPRIVHPQFQQLGLYCTPPDDACPSYNAYLKDELPLTLTLIKKVPDHLLRNFTMDGLIIVSYRAGFEHWNDTKAVVNWTVEYIDSIREQVKARRPYGTYQTTALFPVLDDYAKTAITGKACAVIGTRLPWIEAALLEHGAASVLTIEYARIVTNVPRMHTMTPYEFLMAQQKAAQSGTLETLDSIWSFSSLEHDGLGRFTDPINPYGDLQTMVKISCMLKPGGLLFLAVETNIHDMVYFNLHRLFGRVRYPLLFRYFHLVQVYIESITDDIEEHNQPVLVLQNKIGCL